MFLIINLLSIIATVLGSGEFIVLDYPKSISFREHENLKQSLVKDVLSTSLGFSIPEGNSWSGLYIVDPFHLPECVVTIVIDGVNDIGNIGHQFALRNDESEASTWDSLQERVKERYPYGSNILARIKLSDGIESLKNNEIFNKMKTVELKNNHQLDGSVPEVARFLNDITILNSVENFVEDQLSSDSSPDVFWFVLSSLHELYDLYGKNSSAAIEAREMLIGALLRLSESFSRAYKGNALVTVITSDNSHTRRVARAVSEKPVEAQKNLNLAKNYNPDYPVIFNIILWFGVAMFFALLAISLVIGSMDPGRDSIIYRMTSNRMKKEN